MTKNAPPSALMSMTGFAVRSGSHGPWRWSAELRGVNGKGLDLRLRVPDWIEGLEPALRAAVTGQVGRGNLTMNLRIAREEGASSLAISPGGLPSMLAALAEIEAQAMEVGLALAPSTATQIAGLRGVLESVSEESSHPELRTVLMAESETLLAEFNTMRAHEGAALAKVITAQLDEIEKTLIRAAEAADARGPQIEATLKRNVARVLDAVQTDPQRLAQELAIIATRVDVTEEVDRLRTHIGAARELLGQGGPVGRKLDFLMQEFMREANTLCSKSHDSALTQAGLELKVLIDQMREQVQNVE